jgi:hypothetical protein
LLEGSLGGGSRCPSCIFQLHFIAATRVHDGYHLLLGPGQYRCAAQHIRLLVTVELSLLRCLELLER